ncbi:MAG: hypothetical protein ACK41V_02020 [Acidovorax sp.]|uniref:hypothetical protein n=1 Tax=Acidovorax sp. TaxID=1872122 RepID=UPI00391ABE76
MTSPWYTVLAAAAVFHTAAHSADRTPPAPTSLAQLVVTHPDLGVALQDLKTSLYRPRTPLAFDNGASANNCAEYASLVLTSAPQESVNNASIQSEYLVCDAVRYIASEPFTVDPTLPRTRVAHRAQALFERLDLRTFPSSLQNRTDDRAHTLKTLLISGKVTLTGDTVEVDTSDQFFALQVIAEVRRPVVEGAEKLRPITWIVWVTDESKVGNYRSYSTLIVRPPSQSSTGAYTGTVYLPH